MVSVLIRRRIRVVCSVSQNPVKGEECGCHFTGENGKINATHNWNAG
jgi:hypothetical protein